MEWIKCCEEMPKKECYSYLVWIPKFIDKKDCGYAEVGFFIKPDYFLEDNKENSKITHWMPLPKPPEE